MTAPPAIEVPPPPQGGYMAEDLDRLPGLPPHTELIDGGLFFVSPQKNFHTLTLFLLETALRRWCPIDLVVRREMSVLIGAHQRPEPDIVVVMADAVTSMDQTWYPVGAVVLAVEVVSPDSEERDRHRKPHLYADAGIKHFWRVEEAEGGRPVLHTFELRPESVTYALKGVFLDQVTLNEPFRFEVDLTEITKL
ncbi:MAG TPA: Uma2 family endonuclease [Candidatus Limnocylindrales bacterium]